jgi:hypothetical protein
MDITEESADRGQWWLAGEAGGRVVQGEDAHGWWLRPRWPCGE